MANINATLMVQKYTNDFGVDYPNVFFKIGNSAPSAALTALGYIQRTNLICSLGTGFKMRHFRATFLDGTKHEFPIDDITKTTTYYNALVTAGAVCIDLVGERYRLLNNKAVGRALTYDTNKFVILHGTGKKLSWTYDYSSDILTSATSNRVAIEQTGSGDTINFELAQKKCLTNAIQSTSGVCSTTGLGLKPRHFVIKHRSQIVIPGATTNPFGTVARKVHAADKTTGGLQQCAVDSASVALCLEYQGESFKNIENIL